MTRLRPWQPLHSSATCSLPGPSGSVFCCACTGRVVLSKTPVRTVSRDFMMWAASMRGVNSPGQEDPRSGARNKEEVAMKRTFVIATALLLAACSSPPSWMPGAGWTTLIDGDKGLENFERVGDANWRAEGGAIVADKGKGGHLVTKKSYKDFVLRTEFWAVTETQSGIFIRISDPTTIGSKNAYE